MSTLISIEFGIAVVTIMKAEERQWGPEILDVVRGALTPLVKKESQVARVLYNSLEGVQHRQNLQNGFHLGDLWIVAVCCNQSRA